MQMPYDAPWGGRYNFMKTFLAVFVTCFVFCIFVIGFGFLNGNTWAIIALSALLLAVPVTVLIKLTIRIEELEERVKQLSEEKQNPREH